MDLEMFLQKSRLDHYEFSSLKFPNKQTCRNTCTQTKTVDNLPKVLLIVIVRLTVASPKLLVGEHKNETSNTNDSIN